MPAARCFVERQRMGGDDRVERAHRRPIPLELRSHAAVNFARAVVERRGPQRREQHALPHTPHVDLVTRHGELARKADGLALAVSEEFGSANEYIPEDRARPMAPVQIE